MRPFLFAFPALVLTAGVAMVVAGTTPTPVMAQRYIGIGMGQNVFFSPAGQPFRAAAGQPYPIAAWFNQADTDKDGKLSHDEFTADGMAFFNSLDVNHDGYVNSPENSRYESEVAPEIQRMDPRIQQPTNHYRPPDPEMSADSSNDPTGGRYLKQIIGASQYGLIDEPQPVRAADANFDFRVSAGEWQNAESQRFAILDHNGDGFITLDELPKTPAQLASEAPKDEPGGKDKKKKRGFW